MGADRGLGGRAGLSCSSSFSPPPLEQVRSGLSKKPPNMIVGLSSNQVSNSDVFDRSQLLCGSSTVGDADGYDLANGELRVLLDGLSFRNGVAFLLKNENQIPV